MFSGTKTHCENMRPFGTGPIGRFLRLIRFSHTIFALPFALAALIVAANGWPSPRILLLVIVCMVFARGETFQDKTPRLFREVADGSKICDELRVIAIEGAAPGEIVLHYTSNGGTLIVGDALINFEPYGFTFLPDKYCSSEKEMRRSLRKLLDCTAERILFAHGTPILSGASDRLQRLLDSNR